MENLFFSSSHEPKSQLTRNLVGSIGVTCRSKLAKIVSIGNSRWPPLRPSWKCIFASSPEPKGHLTPNLVGSIELTCKSKMSKKSFRSEIQDGRYGGHLEHLFFASSPEPKGRSTRNLVRSNEVTRRSKIAKIVPIRNPRWPPWLNRAKFFPIGNPRWPPFQKANWLETW